jgi:HEAT repeat protein
MIGQLGDKRATKALLPLLADHASGNEGQRLPVGVAVALALGRLADRRSVPTLLQATHDPDVDVRWATITALGWIGDPRALARLEAVIASEEGEEETWADESLADAARQAIDQISSKHA